MKSFPECMQTYSKQMKKGEMQVAYSGLMQFILGLRNHLKSAHPEFYVSGNFYQGYMDFTYFSFTPTSLKKRKLRIAVVFIHKTMSFKVWLGGLNKKVQAQYWGLISKKGWKKYSVPESVDGIEHIVESLIVTDPDFSNLPKLNNRLEKAIVQFAKDAEQYVSTL